MNDKALELLKLFYRSASKKIVSTINGSTDFSRDRKIIILKEVDVILTDLESKTKKWVDREVLVRYKKGGQDSITLLKDANINLKYKFTKLDQEAMKVIADDTFMNFAEAISGIKRSTAKLLNQATKERIRAIIADGKISASSRKVIANNIAGELKQGFIVLKDKAGKQWNIDTYSEMLANTKLQEAINRGMMNQLSEQGYDLVQVTDHGSNCPLCSPHEGKIFSISGNSKEYDSIDDADGLFHPNCKHRVVPYHEDFASKTKSWSTELQEYI